STVLFLICLIAFYLLIAFSRPDTFPQHELEIFFIFALTLMGPSLTFSVQMRAEARLQRSATSTKEAKEQRDEQLEQILARIQQCKPRPGDDLKSACSEVERLLASPENKSVLKPEELARIWKENN